MSVMVGSLLNILGRYDINRDGKLNRGEVAQGALNMLGNETTQTEGTLLATMVRGGSDRQGLFPDYNNDGAVDRNEFQQLAAAAGNGQTIESADFQQAFGNRYVAGGAPVTAQELQQVAGQNINQFAPPIFNPQQPNNNPQLNFLFGLNPSQPGPNGVGNPQSQAINQFVVTIFQTLFSLMNLLLGGGNAPR